MTINKKESFVCYIPMGITEDEFRFDKGLSSNPACEQFTAIMKILNWNGRTDYYYSVTFLWCQFIERKLLLSRKCIYNGGRDTFYHVPYQRSTMFDFKLGFFCARRLSVTYTYRRAPVFIGTHLPNWRMFHNAITGYMWHTHSIYRKSLFYCQSQRIFEVPINLA